MELVDTDATDSSEQSTKHVCFRPSRSRERRYRKTSTSSNKTRQISTHTLNSNQDSVVEMDTFIKKTSEILYDIKSELVTKRRKFSPIPAYSLNKVESYEQTDEASDHRMRKPSTSVIIHESSGHFRRMSNNAPGSTHGTKTESNEDLEKFSSTTSIQRERSDLSQIVSQIFLPKSQGIKGKFQNFYGWLYDSQNKKYCGRTCRSWLNIILYAILYLIFQMTFTLFWLYISLIIINNNTERWPDVDKMDLQTYAQNGIGLSAVPASERSLPLIWYKIGDPKDYKMYIDAIDLLFKSRTKNDTELRSFGPCGQSPYGYGENPCILVRINKQLGWSANALLPNSTLTSSAPPDVKQWVQTKRMLWLHCAGYNQYDKEHINKIVYYPDPPGIRPNIFPLNMTTDSPVIGIQLLGLTKGMSIGIQCKLWYDTGTSAVEFVIYVVPHNGVSAS